MIKFVFLLTIWTSESPAANVYVEDWNLSGSDCIARMEAQFAADPTHEQGIPSCEIDHAALPATFSHKGQTVTLPACKYEDSQNCYWDAGVRGNGRGGSFYDVDGETFPFHP